MGVNAYTYSFLDNVAALTGPGGSINLAAGAGAAEGGVTIAPTGEIDAMMIGADGTGVHSLIANKSGKITVRLLKTSPTNALLSAMVAFQRTSGSLWGQNTLTLVGKGSGDVNTCQQVAFAKIPDLNYAKESDVIEWEFNANIIDINLGAGVAL